MNRYPHRKAPALNICKAPVHYVRSTTVTAKPVTLSGTSYSPKGTTLGMRQPPPKSRQHLLGGAQTIPRSENF